MNKLAYSVHFLDMGRERYGDSILVKSPAGKSILIDGGHTRDWTRRWGADHLSIPEQLRRVLELEADARIEVDLLVVTHFHADHIGVLPRLVAQEELVPKRALMADPDLGTGRINEGADPFVGLEDFPRDLAFAMLEEDRSGLSDADLREFVSDAGTQYDRYLEMIAKLRRNADVALYTDLADAGALLGAFSDLPLRALGPSREHLLICSRAIQIALSRTRDAMEDLGRTAADSGERLTLPNAYRRLVAAASAQDDAMDAMDRPGKGAAINNQSIVLTVGEGDSATLLTGDMQLAKVETSGLKESMMALRRKLAGCYAVVKTPHHTSYNGLDEEVLDLFEGTKWFVHSGGIEDPTHPDPHALESMNARRQDFQWARTDRNGLIDVKVFGSGFLSSGFLESIRVELARGRVSDPSPNLKDARRPAEPPPERAAPTWVPLAPVAPAPKAPVPAPEVAFVAEGEGVKATVWVPYSAVKVTFSLEIEPKGPLPARDGGRRTHADAFRVGGERVHPLPPLLFVTQKELLARNIGRSEAAEVLAAIQETHSVVQLAEGMTANQARMEVVRRYRGEAGVVLLGGFDVVPSFIRDTITADLRAALDPSVFAGDDDDFIVWSDDDYGDLDGRRYALPITRIPDGRSAELVWAALTAPRTLEPGRRTGILNCQRPFANRVFDRLPGNDVASISEPHHAKNLTGKALAADVVYLMLHGAHWDGRALWGDRHRGGLVEAVTVDNVRNAHGAVVFCGACWGALTVKSPAGLMHRNEQVSPKAPEASLPLTFLRAGANAFLGCTGLHYSPTNEPYDYFGGPLHHAFWDEYLAGHPPAEALRRAKITYLKGIGVRSSDLGMVAVELKILEQFTCLGLGW